MPYKGHGSDNHTDKQIKHNAGKLQVQRKVFLTGQAKPDTKHYSIKYVGGQ